MRIWGLDKLLNVIGIGLGIVFCVVVVGYDVVVLIFIVNFVVFVSIRLFIVVFELLDDFSNEEY